MRSTTLLFSLGLALAMTPALAQNSADQAGTATPQEQQGNAMQGSESMKTMHDAGPGHATHCMHGMSGRHAEMMKTARADLAAMRALLQKMNDQAGRMTDRVRQEELQMNNDLWQALLAHMDRHMTSMDDMMGGGMEKPHCGGAMRKSNQHYAQ